MDHNQQRAVMEFQIAQILDAVSRGGGSVDESGPAPRNSRPSFAVYVVAPAFVISFSLAAGILGIAIVGREFWNLFLLSLKPDLTMLMVGCPLIMFGFAFGFIAANLLPTWQQAQLQIKRTSFQKRENLPDTGRSRIMVDSEPHTKHISRIEWQNGGLDELSRRCHDEFGNWAAGNHIRRELFERRKDDDRSMPIFVNVTGNYSRLLQDFYDWGWTNTADVKSNPRWLSKGKEDLRKRLFFSAPPS